MLREREAWGPQQNPERQHSPGQAGGEGKGKGRRAGVHHVHRAFPGETELPKDTSVCMGVSVSVCLYVCVCVCMCVCV